MTMIEDIFTGSKGVPTRAPVKDPGRINIVNVEQWLRDQLIPVTKHMANLMSRPRVIVTGETIQKALACNYVLDAYDVAIWLAQEAGYGLDVGGRYDFFPKNLTDLSPLPTYIPDLTMRNGDCDFCDAKGIRVSELPENDCPEVACEDCYARMMSEDEL